MSKQVEAEIDCLSCGKVFETRIFRWLWIELPRNRRLVCDDEVNVVACPACERRIKLEYPFLCTNARKRFAAWWGPYPDAGIDQDIAAFAATFGEDSFYARAPRIRDWGEFRKTVQAMED